MSYVLALAAACVAAVTSVLQRIGIEKAPADASMKLGLMAHAVRRKIWLVGFGLMLVQFVLQAVALRFGQLSTVQPVLTTELIFLVLILTFVFHHRLRSVDWMAVAAVVVGLASFIVIAHPATGRGIPSQTAWLAVTFVMVAVVTALVLAARSGPRWWRAASFGAASAVLVAYNAAIIKAVTTLVTEGWGHVFVSWEPYALAISGLGSLFLLQNALHAGPLTASRATIVIVNPLVSIVIGVTAFEEHLRTGSGYLVGEMLALSVLFLGAFVLTQSPLVAGVVPGGPGEFLGEASTAFSRQEVAKVEPEGL
ncbi:MAG TPA: DMT family transporter [Acidimicrobiales bacterium]|nr:DMT family transporter [Acidimicrobiales bacterium]